jgi:hypothetical protein
MEFFLTSETQVTYKAPDFVRIRKNKRLKNYQHTYLSLYFRSIKKKSSAKKVRYERTGTKVRFRLRTGTV